MQKNEPKDNCPPPSPLSRDISVNNNYIHEPNKVNNNNIYENLKVSIGITFNELESLTKETLIQLIQFINYSCNFNLKSIKYSNYCCNIFEIKENLNRDGYNIVISKNEFNELNSKFRNKNEDINENKINLFLPKEINEEKHNYCLPISCPDHNNIKFNSLTSYLNHCKEGHKIFACKDCGKSFEDFNNFKLHIYKILNIEDENININNKDNDAPPLLENLIEPKKLENNIRCTKCDLIFDSIEKMSVHFYETHEKKIAETSEINGEFQQNKNQSSNENVKECSVNRIEHIENEEKIENVNQKEEKIENLNQNEEKKIKNEEAVKKLSFERGEELEIIKEISWENSIKKNSNYLQKKRNYEKEEIKGEILIKKEEFKIQEDLKKQEELKRQEDLKNQEELKRQEDLKNQENLKIQEELIKQEDLKEEIEIINDGFYFECLHDNKRFPTQNLFFEHFRKKHSNTCCMCGKKFSIKNSLKHHYNSSIKSHNIIKCKLCCEGFLTVNSLIEHCEHKNH